MRAEKGGTKSGGFFHLFDWNRKSRKKLFSNGTVSPESSKHERRSVNNLPSKELHLDDEDEIVGVSSVKDSSDYSCASSVTDEGFTIRPPGVVARLMGLDSMPTSGASEPSATPFFDSRFLREKLSHKRSPEFCINDQFNNVSHRTESYARKPMELRSQKMPSSPIERFQTETIPSRSSKSLLLSHHKLLSPIKIPGFISSKNAAHIMEAAAKILDTGLQPSMRAKVSSFGSSSIPLKVRDSKENMMATQCQRTMRILESARMPAESTDGRCAARGQPMNRCWNGPEDNTIYRRLPNSADATSADAKSKGKSISLAVQAKVNVQRREGLSSSYRYASVQKDQEECKVNHTFRSQPNNQKNKQQRKPATSNASGVLKQNNQKQNCLSNKSKLSQKQMVNNQHGRKVLSGGDATSTKNKTVNKLSGNSRFVHRKEGSEIANLERDEFPSTNKDFPQKKRLIERGFASEKSESADNGLGDRHHKHIQSNVVVDECTYSRWAADSRSNGADVVSFTFTSPLIKPVPRTGSSSIQVAERLDKRNMDCLDTYNQRKDSNVKDKKAYHGLNVITGDALSVLLEQKLRELQSGVGISSCSFLKSDSFSASSSITQELVSGSDTPSTSTAEHERKIVHRPSRDSPAGAFHPGISSTNGLGFGLSKLQRAEEVGCSSSSDARKEPSLQHTSPLSTLESSFSSESFVSTERSDSSNGSKVCSSSIQAKNVMTLNSVNKNLSPEVEMELFDSASSTLSSDTFELSRSQIRGNNEELDYVKEISSLCSLGYAETLDPLIFDKLEGKRRRQGKACKMRRKVLFDCVNESLDLKCSRYFRAGYKSWAKGMEVGGKENLAEELYEDISGWQSMGDWMVDELVDKDMSTHRGRWVDFEIEAFEAGKEIESEIVSSLLDEMIADYLICKEQLISSSNKVNISSTL